jgi:hypothetical protein
MKKQMMAPARGAKPQRGMKKKPTSIPVKSQPTRMVPPQAGPMQQGPQQQYQPQQPPMKKGGKMKKKNCRGGCN